MVELIASILFIGSTAGAIAIVAKKMPAAGQLPEKVNELPPAGFLGMFKDLFASLIKKNPYLKNFSWIDLAQKTLLKGKLVALKTENKINEYMVRLRQRAEDQKQKEEALLDNYWRDLKTMVKTRKPLVGKNPDSKISHVKVEVKSTEEKSNNLDSLASVKSEPMIGRVVMPSQVSDKTDHHKKKRSSNSKSGRFRDPFRW